MNVMFVMQISRKLAETWKPVRESSITPSPVDYKNSSRSIASMDNLSGLAARIQSASVQDNGGGGGGGGGGGAVHDKDQ